MYNNCHWDEVDEKIVAEKNANSQILTLLLPVIESLKRSLQQLLVWSQYDTYDTIIRCSRSDPWLLSGYYYFITYVLST